MSQVAFEKPVEDSVAKVNHEVAVGEDLEFQRAWWKFERVVWSLFLLIIACDIAGLFGRGPLAHAHLENSAMQLKYDRVERFGTPSMVSVNLQPSAVQPDGKFHLFVSDSLVNELGAQRVIPSPELTAIGSGGLSYIFPATPGQATAQFELHPTKPGSFYFTIQAPGTDPLRAHVVVMP